MVEKEPYISNMEAERRKIINGSNDYLKMLEATDILEKTRSLINEISERSDVSILAQPQLHELYAEIVTVIRYLEAFDWMALKEK